MKRATLALLGAGIIGLINSWSIACAWFNQSRIEQSVSLSKQVFLGATSKHSSLNLSFSYPNEQYGLTDAQQLKPRSCLSCQMNGWAAFQLASQEPSQAHTPSSSRLYVTAIAEDKSALKTQYPTQDYVLMPVTIHYRQHSQQSTYIELRHKSLHTTFAQRQTLAQCASPSIVLNWGRLDMPWISAVNCGN